MTGFSAFQGAKCCGSLVLIIFLVFVCGRSRFVFLKTVFQSCGRGSANWEHCEQMGHYCIGFHKQLEAWPIRSPVFILSFGHNIHVVHTHRQVISPDPDVTPSGCFGSKCQQTKPSSDGRRSFSIISRICA